MLKSLRKRHNVLTAYKEIFNSDNGKLIMHDLMRSCFITTSTMTSDPHETAYNEGMRSVVLRIIKTINIDPKELEKLINSGGQSEQE